MNFPKCWTIPYALGLSEVFGADCESNDEWNWILDSEMIYSGYCLAIISVMDCSPPAAFVSCVSSKRRIRDEALLPLCRRSEWKRAVDSHFCSHQRPSHGRHKHCCSVESLGMCGSLWGWPTFAPLFGLMGRAVSCTAERTACNVIPSDCRCKALQATTNEAWCADAAWMFCIMHACVFSAATYSKMYSLVYFKWILILPQDCCAP